MLDDLNNGFNWYHCVNENFESKGKPIERRELGMVIDPQRVTDIIRETAELDVLPRFQNLADHDIIEKSPGDIVTVADYEAEDRLSKALSELSPGADILAEEAASRDGRELDNYHSEVDTWLIDPVDGTRNFSKGKTPFAIVVAYVAGGCVELAWIHLPVENQTIVAERGSGAFIVGGEKLVISNDVPIRSMTGLINFRALDATVSVEQMKSRAEAFSELHNFRCAGFDFVQLAKGNKHFSLYRRLWPWDHAAGSLIYREAGGYVARVDRQEYNPLERTWGLLCAQSQKSWNDIYDHLSTPN